MALPIEKPTTTAGKAQGFHKLDHGLAVLADILPAHPLRFAVAGQIQGETSAARSNAGSGAANSSGTRLPREATITGGRSRKSSPWAK
jgi:hypothetical protein